MNTNHQDMDRARPLTDRQAQVLRYITDYLTDHGYPPTQREIMKRFKIKSTKGVDRHLEALEKKGYLTRTRKGARALEVHGLSQTRGIPVVGKVAAGRPILAIENIEGTLALDRKVVRWKDAFFLKVKGDSMIEAGILNGDYVLVKPQPTAEDEDIVVAIMNGEATVKRFVRKEDRILLEAANPDYPPIEITGKSGELRIIGKVMAVFRSLTGPLA
jgi:repressor LexA